jgi:hypothetical protein
MKMCKAVFFIWAITALTVMISIADAQDSLFAPPVRYSVSFSSELIIPSDLNGDGIVDLALTDQVNDHATVLINNGNGTFRAAAYFSTGSIPISLCAADFNGDGNNDIATSNVGSDNISILENNGDGTFRAAINYYAGSAPRFIFASDLDSDYDYDLIVADEGYDSVTVFKNNGDGIFQVAARYLVGTAPYSIFVSDFDNDGDNDMAVTNIYSNNISILMNKGNATFGEAINYGTGTYPFSIFACDFDGDSDKDLVTANNFSDDFSILKNNGDGTFQPAINYDAGTHPVSVCASDIDLDGDNDLAIANYGIDDSLSIFLNNGDGTFQAPINYSIRWSLMSVTASDFDEDGDNDLAVSVGNDVGILFNRTYSLSVFHLLWPSNNMVVGNGILTWSSTSTEFSSQQILYKVFWDSDSLFNSPDSSSELTDTTFILPETTKQSQKYFWRIRTQRDTAEYRYSKETWSFYLDGYPTKPIILSPENERYADSLTMLSWVKSTDPDSFDGVTYLVQIDEDSHFGSPEIYNTVSNSGLILEEAIAVQINEFPDYINLLPDTRYYWRVRSEDNYALYSNWPDTTHFFTYNHLNHTPLPPDSGFSPANFEEVISLTPTITWNNASDPDPDDNPGTLHYILRLFSDTSTGCGYEYWDTTADGINQVVVADTMPDNCLWIYMVQTIDDQGLASGWSPMQRFWTNHYNFPPEPFPLGSPSDNLRHVALHIKFKWGRTVDYDPLASFRYAFQYSPDSLFASGIRTIYGLTDTSLILLTDTLATLGDNLYWRILAIDDDSLIRVGGIPEQIRRLTIFPPGDANGDHSVLGGDVTYLVRFFKGLGNPPNPFFAGDANGDCQVLGSDVTFLVRYFKGLGPAPARMNCEEPGIILRTVGQD